MIYAKRVEDLPIVRKLGDIIRVHRANAKEYQETKQYHVNVFFNSSWCLFSQDEGKDSDYISDNDFDDDKREGD